MAEQKFLIIKLGALGDFILQLGWVFALHKKYPDAHFTFMTTKPFVPFVKCMPFIENIIVDKRPRYNVKDWLDTCKKGIADTKWDMIFDLQASKRTSKKYFSLVRFLSPFSVHWAYLSPEGFTVLNVEKKHRFTMGKLTKTSMSFAPMPIDLSFCKGEQKNFHLLPEKPFMLLIPGCSALHPYKRWPAEKYLELALRAEEKGIPTVVLGTDAEAKEIQTICQNSKAVNFQSKASLLDIPALAARSCVIVGNDTGPVHMSCFVQKPAIVLFCQRTARSANKMANITNLVADQIEDISVDAVWKEVQKSIKCKKD
ncbi:MAG: glycosyltransferase family 9 protein [Alphaproteobacteria bacterium]|nr:glycosyltransferase family 9 protein [Alphaproteobacteria bacterium]